MDIVRLTLQTGANLEAHTDDGRDPIDATTMMRTYGRHAFELHLLFHSGKAVDFRDYCNSNPRNGKSPYSS
jgi:hypothetical protein